MADWIISAAVILAVWVAFWWFPEFRTIRTVALLSAASLILLLAWTLPTWASIGISLTVAALLLAVHLRFNRWILAYSPAEVAFTDSLLEINRDLLTRYDEAVTDRDRYALREALAQAFDEVERLDPPGPEWHSVKLHASQLLRDRLMVLDTDDASLKTRMRFRSRRSELHEELRRARARTARFWR